MLTIERFAQSSSATATAVPRITPSRPHLDRRGVDLSFVIDIGRRPVFRVLVAKDRALFEAARKPERNAGNFYDSIAEGLLPFDGPPGFYLLPRAALSAMLPARELFYTLIAYDDREGTQAVYAHPPEEVGRTAPSVTVDSELRVGSLSTMFGTPVDRLLRVGAAQAAAFDDPDEGGEDVSAQSLDALDAIGLEAGEDMDGDEDDTTVLAQAAAADAGQEDGWDQGDSGGDWDYQAQADGGQDYDDGYGDASGEVHRPTHEAAAHDGDDDAHAAGLEAAYAGEDVGEDAPAGAASAFADGLDDGYDDGFDEPIAPAQAASHGEDDGEDYGADAMAFDAPTREPVPEALPDEDADPRGAAQGDLDDPDEVDVEPVAQGLEADDYASSYEALAAAAEPARARVPLDIDACKALLARIMPFESGQEGFSRVGADGEFSGRYGQAHPAYQRFHLGLTFGAFPFVQEHGTLGQLLSLMRERDATAFARIFGAGAGDLISVTTDGEGPRAWDSGTGLSRRLRPVGEGPLWQEPWLGRFKEAGRHPPFQGAQNELAARLYIQPMLSLAGQLGLDSEQALTLLVDRAVQMGPQAAAQWVLDAVSPLQSPAQRQQALARLGHADLRAFQQAKGLPASGDLDTATHAALLAELRGRADAPVPVPTRGQMLDAMARRAEGSPWAGRMRHLREATASADRLFSL